MKKKILVIVMPIAAILIGIAGFMQAGMGFYEALLASFKLLTIEFDPVPVNTLVEIGRWLGYAFFFGLVYTAITAVFESGVLLAKTRRSDVVAVHGDSVYSELLLEALGKKGIKSDRKIALKAPVQFISYDNDNDAIELFQMHSDVLKEAKEVHLCLKTDCLVSEADNVFVTNLSEIRSIDYWRNNFCESKKTIAIIGSGLLAENVLLWGLLTNIFDIDCGNKYLVFGDFKRFRAIHGDVEKSIKDFGNDSITFRDKDWFSHIDEVKAADRIILCGETLSNVENAQDIQLLGVKGEVHLFAENNSIASFIDDKVAVVGTLSKDNIKDVLMMNSVHRSGELCHATYMVLKDADADKVNSDSIKEFVSSEKFKESWKALMSFTRVSNYASAIHYQLKKSLLMGAGLDVRGMTASENKKAYEELSESEKNRLQEIEHIRWSRYHLLNNWNKPEDAKAGEKVRDFDNKLHFNLVPYSELSAEDQKKDAYFFETLALRI